VAPVEINTAPRWSWFFWDSHSKYKYFYYYILLLRKVFLKKWGTCVKIKNEGEGG